MVSRHFVSITALLACGLVPALALQTWSLGDSATWSLNNSAGSANISDVPVTLPSCALGSLLEDGRLAGDPLYRCRSLRRAVVPSRPSLHGAGQARSGKQSRL